MKTNLTLKMKDALMLLVEKPLSVIVATMAISIFLMLEKPVWFLAIPIAALAVTYFLLTGMFITRFAKKANRIALIYYGKEAVIYEKPIWGKVPSVEIMFPSSWDMSRKSDSEYQTELFLGVKISDNITYHLYFQLKVQTFGAFKAHDLQKLIALQRAKNLVQTKFEFIDCLEDYLLIDCVSNHQAIIVLLENYRQENISLFHLETSILRLIKVPELFTNVKKMELKFSTTPQRVIQLDPHQGLKIGSRAAAVL